MEEVARKFQEFINDPRHIVGSENGEILHIINPILAIPEIKELFTDRIVQAIECYFQCPITIKTVRAWRTSHVSEVDQDRQDVFSNTFHNDNYPYWGVRVFLLVSKEVTRRSGAFRFHDKPNSKRIARKLGFFHRAKMSSALKRLLLSPGNLNYFEGEMGDVCVCNTQVCIHGASIPEEGLHRDVIQFEVYPSWSSDIKSGQLFANVNDDLEELTEIYRRDDE